MARKRQVILLKIGERESAGETPEMSPLGTVAELVETLARYNIAPDGSGQQGMGEALGMAVLHGPGMVVEIPTGGDEVAQVMVTLTDEDFAWAVLIRLCKIEHWKMLDPESGRTFG